MKNTTGNFRKVKAVLLNITLIIIGALVLKSCAMGIEGSGNVVKEDRKVERFTKIDAGGAFEIFIRQGDHVGLSIVADDNLVESVETYVESGTLYLSFEDYLKDFTKLQAFITVKEIDRIELSGACSIESKSTLKTKELSVDISGASEVDLDLFCNTLIVVASGASSVKLSGSVNSLSADLSGASSLNGKKLNIKTAKVEASGSSGLTLAVEEKIMANLSGASSLKYKGNPEVQQQTSGASSVSKIK